MLIAPPARMISPPSMRSVPPPWRSMSTATARRPSNTTPVTNVRVRTVRFFRPRTGLRYACEADSRRPSWMLRSNGAKPSWR